MGATHCQKVAGEQNCRTQPKPNTHNFYFRDGGYLKYVNRWGLIEKLLFYLYIVIKGRVMKVPDEFFNGDDLSDYEKEAIEKKMLENAFENSYRIITKRITFDDLMKDLTEGTIIAALTAHDPDEDPPKIILENMIAHFSSEDYEEYEKCVELKKELNRLYPETNENN